MCQSIFKTERLPVRSISKSPARPLRKTFTSTQLHRPIATLINIAKNLSLKNKEKSLHPRDRKLDPQRTTFRACEISSCILSCHVLFSSLDLRRRDSRRLSFSLLVLYTAFFEETSAFTHEHGNPWREYVI